MAVCLYTLSLDGDTNSVQQFETNCILEQNARVLHDTGLEFCQENVRSIKRIIYRYILTNKIYLRLATQFICTVDV